MEQKIIYPETTNGAYFYLDSNKFFIEKTCFMITGNNLEYLTATLSSSLYEFAYKKLFSSIELGKNGYQYNKHALLLLPIARVCIKYIAEIKVIVKNMMRKHENNNENIQTIDDIIFKIYNLNNEEKKLILSNL